MWAKSLNDVPQKISRAPCNKIESSADRAMKDGWWSIPSIIDVTNTNFVWIPVLHGEVLAVVWKG